MNEFNILLLICTFGLLILLYYVYIYANNSTTDNVKASIIKKLSRQASRWTIASQQDQSPMIAVLHANYGAGYLWALKDISNANEIFRATGINIDKFENKILQIQDISTRKAVLDCPTYKGAVDNYLQSIASSSN